MNPFYSIAYFAGTNYHFWNHIYYSGIINQELFQGYLEWNDEIRYLNICSSGKKLLILYDLTLVVLKLSSTLHID